MLNQIDMFRNHGLGRFDNLLVELSKDPAMLLWLDNTDNHKGAINENFGRELLELFSMGIGNYTEDDIKECSRAFTGWDAGQRRVHGGARRQGFHLAVQPNRLGTSSSGIGTMTTAKRRSWARQGDFNGEDIIEIIARQEATARFVCTRLFQFFAADKVDAEGEQVIEDMMKSYFDSGYEIRAVLRALFLSDYFTSENARYARVKGPVELLVGAIRQAGSYREPILGVHQLAYQGFYMGQGLLQSALGRRLARGHGVDR